MQTDLQATEEELNELRKQRAAAEKRLDAFRKLNDRLRKLVDTGKLEVAFRNGQMVLKLPSEILFASGRHKLSKPGKEALKEVTEILLEFKDRRFMIAGHTDNQKIKTKRFPNNWHLSTSRAVSILEFFIEQGFAPNNLGAAGFGEFDPVAENDTPEGRTQNRRIEIILVPDLSELPNLVGEEDMKPKEEAPAEGEAKEEDASKDEAEEGDAKKDEAKGDDAKKGDAKKGDAKKGDAKKGDAKKGDAKGKKQ